VQRELATKELSLPLEQQYIQKIVSQPLLVKGKTIHVLCLVTMLRSRAHLVHLVPCCYADKTFKTTVGKIKQLRLVAMHPYLYERKCPIHFMHLCLTSGTGREIAVIYTNCDFQAAFRLAYEAFFDVVFEITGRHLHFSLYDSNSPFHGWAVDGDMAQLLALGEVGQRQMKIYYAEGNELSDEHRRLMSGPPEDMAAQQARGCMVHHGRYLLHCLTITSVRSPSSHRNGRSPEFKPEEIPLIREFETVTKDKVDDLFRRTLKHPSKKVKGKRVHSLVLFFLTTLQHMPSYVTTIGGS
jgi:hypothetical protein